MQTTLAAPVLRVDSLEKSFGARKILNRVSFRVAAGERVALMGPSGSGKTTLLNCLGGIEQADDGVIHFDGKDLTRLDENALAALRRQPIGQVFQFFHLLPTLTAAENVELPLRLLGLSTQDRREKVRALLDETGVTHRADAQPGQLSGGECQRVAIARALAPEPVLLLADEPTGNLDQKTGAAILDLLAAASERHGTAMVMVTHDEASTRICHRVVRMVDGRVENDG